MTEKKLKKIMKRDRRRKRAQGIGALAGTATAFAILGFLFGDQMKDEAKTIANDAKEAIDKVIK